MVASRFAGYCHCAFPAAALYGPDGMWFPRHVRYCSRAHAPCPWRISSRSTDPYFRAIPGYCRPTAGTRQAERLLVLTVQRSARSAFGAFVGATAYAVEVAALAIDALLDGLNPEQRAAVVHEGSPLLIVAGAGSGKTRVLTHRIAYLLAARDVAPHEILAITFTNKAAGEMAARVAALVGPRVVGPRSMWVMTFHSACVRILRREARRFGYPSSFSI